MMHQQPPIEALASLIEGAGSPAPLANLVSRYGDVVQLFDERGWLRRGPKAGFASCRLCNEGHNAEVSFDPRTGLGRYSCVTSGSWALADDAGLETRVVALDAVLVALRAALAPIEFATREEVPGVLWMLGESRRCGLAWTAMLARNVRNDNLALILERLPEVATKPGLVLTTTPTPPTLDAGPFRFRRLQAVVALDVEGALSINENAIKAALRIARERRQGPGRPSDYEDEGLAVIAAAGPEELKVGNDELIELVRSRVPGLETKSHGKIGKTLRACIIDAADARCALLGIKR